MRGQTARWIDPGLAFGHFQAQARLPGAGLLVEHPPQGSRMLAFSIFFALSAGTIATWLYGRPAQ